MLRKFSYLASVSVVATLAMSPYGQAMDKPLGDENLVTTKRSPKKQEQDFTKQDVIDAAFQIVGSHPSDTIGLHEEARLNFRRNVQTKGATFARISRAILSGNYDEIAGETIELLIASLCGKDEALKSLLGQSNKEFDTNLITTASNTLVTRFLKELSKHPDLYGELPDGTRVTIYNRSFFKMFAEQFFPKIPIFTGLAVKILDTEALKGHIQKKLIETVLGYFTDYLGNKNIFLKEELGRNAVTLGRETSNFITAESSTDYKEVWNYLSPHLTYHLRHYIISLIEEAKNKIIKENEAYLKNGAALATYFSTSYVASVTGSALYTIGSYANSPILTVPGALLSSYGGLATTGGLCAAYVNYGYWDPLKNRANKWLDDKLALWALKLLPPSREEHVLYWLNPNASPIEKGLFFEDYQLLDELNSQSFFRNVLKGAFEKTGARAVLDYFYGGEALPSDLLQYQYCMFEEEEQAFRRLMALKEENPTEAKIIEGNLKKYPSFKQKMKSLTQSQATLPDEDQDYIDSRKQITKRLRGAAARLVRELCALDSQCSLSKDTFYAAFLEEIVNSSTESQDYLLEFVQKERVALKQFFTEHTQAEDLPEQDAAKPLQPIAIKEKTKALFEELMKKCIHQYMNDEQKKEIEKNEYILGKLKALPLTERMDDIQILRMNKRIVPNFFEKFGPILSGNSMVFIDTLLDDYLSVKDQNKLACVSREFYKWRMDIRDDLRIEKLFDIKTLNEGEKDYFNKHRHDIIVIANTHHKLKVDHIAFTLYDIYNEHLEQMNVWEKVQYESTMWFIKEMNFTPSFEQLTGKIRQVLIANPEFQAVSSYITPLRDKDDEVKKLYNELRDKLLEKPEHKVLKELALYMEGGKLPSKPSPVEESSNHGLLGRFWKPQILTEEMVQERYKKAHESLTHRDLSAQGWTGKNLCHTLRSMPFENDYDLSLKDFIQIHEKTLEIKLEKASKPAKEFVGKYGEYIVCYKSMSPKFRDRLFYDYEELIVEIRSKKNAYLKALVSNEKK